MIIRKNREKVGIILKGKKENPIRSQDERSEIKGKDKDE